MSTTQKIALSDNEAFNTWLRENNPLDIDGHTLDSSEALYTLNYDGYIESLDRYLADPKIKLSRIEHNFPTPIAYYFYQATKNYQNPHHRLDLLKSCWESLIFLLYGLVVGEARHRQLDLRAVGVRWNLYWSDKINDKLNIIENILNYVVTNALDFECSTIIPLPTIAEIRQLNRERNGFAHASAKTEAQQRELYNKLYPDLERILRQLIKLEQVILFRYYEAETPLYPRCEIFNGYSMEGKKDIVTITKHNYIDIIDYFDKHAIFAHINTIAFTVAPFIHFVQQTHETNAVLCFYKQHCMNETVYDFEIFSRSETQSFDYSAFGRFIDELELLVV